MNNKLAILIPTIVGREKFLERLLAVLLPQVDEFIGDVHVLIESDNREMTTGAKRNKLMQRAIEGGFTHRAFIDDDDLISDNYLKLNMPGVYGDYDCNSLVGVITHNGYKNPQKHLFYHSLLYTHWYDDANGYYRNPNHLNVVKIDLIKDIPFRDITVGEDGNWSVDIAKAGVLKRELLITEPFYFYEERTKVDGI